MTPVGEVRVLELPAVLSTLSGTVMEPAGSAPLGRDT